MKNNKEQTLSECIQHFLKKIFWDHINKKCKNIIIDLIAGLFSLMIFLIFYLSILNGVITHLIVFIFLCVIVFIFGCLISELWQNLDDPRGTGLSIFQNVAVGILFVVFFYCIQKMFKGSDTEGWGVLSHILVFILGFLFSEMIGGYIKINKSVIKLQETTQKMYEKVVSELMDFYLSGYLSEHHKRDVFHGPNSIGICEEAVVDFVTYEDIAIHIISKARTSLYAALIFSPALLLDENEEVFKKYFRKFADANIPDKRRVLVPPLHGPKWNDSTNEDVKKKFFRFINEYNKGKNCTEVKVRVFENFSKRPYLYYGDMLIIDKKVALNYTLHQPFDGKNIWSITGTLEIICGEVVEKEYLRIFQDDIFEDFKKPEDYFPEAFPNKETPKK